MPGLAILMATNVVSGCVYYNLFYNVKRSYNEAEKAQRLPDGNITRQASDAYDKVIDKCQQLILQHPDSKYVDDAVLLIGKSQYAKGEYIQAIIKFEELQENFPDSDLNEEGQLYLGMCYIAQDKPASAVLILSGIYEAKPKSKYADKVLYNLGLSLIRIGDMEQALEYLQQLARRYPNSNLRLEADLEMANVYTEAGEYEKALELYTKLAGARTSTPNKIRYLNKLSEVYVKMGEYDEALKTLKKLQGYVLDDLTMAAQMLLESEAYAGKGELPKAIDGYESVVARFPRSKFAAEAYFRMGDLYQTQLDSLDVAKEKFDQVPRQYANSPFAKDAVQRSVAIAKRQRLQTALAQGGGQDQALVQFELAETELLQFNNHEEALVGYVGILNDFPESDVAPKAAYAVAYIYEKILDDASKAQRAYLRLVTDYPFSQQAGFARAYLGIVPPDPVEESRSDSPIDQ